MRTLDRVLSAIIAGLTWAWKRILAGSTWYWAKLNPAGRVGVVVLLVSTLFFAWLWWTKPSPPAGGTPSGPVTVTVPGKAVTFYKDRVVYRNAAGNPATVTHPPESSPSVDDEGVLHVSQAGFCLLPKIGMAYLFADPAGLDPYASFRLAYWKGFGIEAGASPEGPLAGVDLRLPYVNNITLSAGTCPRLGLPFNAWRPYAGAGVFVRY